MRRRKQIIAAANKNIEEEVEKGNFREDLYYRLNVIPLFLPPLKDRKDDIPLLAGHFLAKYSRQMRKNVKRLSKRAQDALLGYDWPGNVRELENIIQRHVALTEKDFIDEIRFRGTCGWSTAAAPVSASRSEILIAEEGVDLEAMLEDFERRHMLEALRMTGGNLTNASKLLGMSYRSFRYRVKKLGLKDVIRV